MKLTEETIAVIRHLGTSDERTNTKLLDPCLLLREVGLTNYPSCLPEVLKYYEEGRKFAKDSV